MVFDGDCGFCRFWILRWQRITGNRVDFVPFQELDLGARFPELPRKVFETAVQLIEPDGFVYSGAEAAFRALAHNPHYEWLLGWYAHSPAFARAAEFGYRCVAQHRAFFSALTRLAWGSHVEPSTYVLVRRLFLRALAIIYLIAFVSLWVQIIGLIGSEGILPAKATMETARSEAAAAKLGWDRYHLVPTLCWFNASDRFLEVQCAAGAALAVLLFLGIAPAPCLFLLWLIYLSLSTVCREFLSFQWDILLLETGFMAIFFAPLQLWPRFSRAGPASTECARPLAQQRPITERALSIQRLQDFLACCARGRAHSGSAITGPPSRLVLWLLRWLLFRLMFESGCVKWLSGDPTWRNLTALTFHYETQPLPTWIGWYAHQFPIGIQKISTALMFGIELLAPFLIFAPRRLRQVGCGTFIVLQVFILLTGNYCFFNLLTIALCLLLLDDTAISKLLPSKCRVSPTLHSPLSTPHFRRWPRQITVPLACITLVISFVQFGVMFRLPIPWPPPIGSVYGWLAPFRSFNSYGLFAVMTTSRSEIILEGSNDGVTWLEYEFKYKPGDGKRRPGFVEPHQPRLDWQMWFAALGSYRNNPWFVNFCFRLLKGSPEVLALIEHNPFPNAPPRYLRPALYEYHFTDFATRRKTGAWWRRERKGDHMPVLEIRNSDQ